MVALPDLSPIQIPPELADFAREQRAYFAEVDAFELDIEYVDEEAPHWNSDLPGEAEHAFAEDDQAFPLASSTPTPLNRDDGGIMLNTSDMDHLAGEQSVQLETPGAAAAKREFMLNASDMDRFQIAVEQHQDLAPSVAPTLAMVAPAAEESAETVEVAAPKRKVIGRKAKPKNKAAAARQQPAKKKTIPTVQTPAKQDDSMLNRSYLERLQLTVSAARQNSLGVGELERLMEAMNVSVAPATPRSERHPMMRPSATSTPGQSDMQPADFEALLSMLNQSAKSTPSRSARVSGVPVEGTPANAHDESMLNRSYLERLQRTVVVGGTAPARPNSLGAGELERLMAAINAGPATPTFDTFASAASVPMVSATPGQSIMQAAEFEALMSALKRSAVVQSTPARPAAEVPATPIMREAEMEALMGVLDRSVVVQATPACPAAEVPATPIMRAAEMEALMGVLDRSVVVQATPALPTAAVDCVPESVQLLQGTEFDALMSAMASSSVPSTPSALQGRAPAARESLLNESGDASSCRCICISLRDVASNKKLYRVYVFLFALMLSAMSSMSLGTLFTS
jgi:hypothetical protein